jgi:protein phosphatase 2C family protein 2/3
MQGYRTNMEDAHHVAVELKGHPGVTYVGMFDGHNGERAAEWMAEQLQIRLSELSDPTNHEQLTKVIEKADADFMADNSRRAHGCTACIALITQLPNGSRKLTVANCGDSRCLVIGSDGSVKFTTVDHKPDTEGESRRIHAAGGSVSCGRVDGDLGMSRSIGDHGYKNVPHLGPLEQKVVPTPDCSDIELDSDDIVLVCCDGLVEKLSNEQVAKHIHEQIAGQTSASELDPANIMASLLDFSLQRGSKDNMSAALILPVDGSSYARADEYRVGPFAEWSTDRGFVEAFMGDAKKHGQSTSMLCL